MEIPVRNVENHVEKVEAQKKCPFQSGEKTGSNPVENSQKAPVPVKTNRYGRFFCEYSCAGISFFLGTVPIDMIAGQRHSSLSRLHFCFLQSQNIRILFFHKIRKTLLHTGSQAIYIPRYQFHRQSIAFFLCIDKYDKTL